VAYGRGPMLRHRHRALLGLLSAAALTVAAVGPATAGAADAVTVAWMPDSPFIVFADQGRETIARPTFSVKNATAAQVYIEPRIQLDPPEVVGPEDAHLAHCTSDSPVAGDTAVGSCSVPITTKQVTDGTVIKATIAWKAFLEGGALVASGTTTVLEVSAVRNPAELSVTIVPLPQTVLVAPADQVIEYDVENTGTVDLDTVAVEVEIEPARATGTPRRTVCVVDAGPLAVGAIHHETCTVSLTEADASDAAVRVAVVARGTGAGQTASDGSGVSLSLVLPGAHLVVYLLEIGLNDTRPAPGDTVILEIQAYNVGAETLDVTTRTDPSSPDCVLDLGAIAAAEARVEECDFLIPADATVCLMPYTVYATGVASDGQTVEASIDSVAGLTQPDDLCGAGGAAPTEALPAAAAFTPPATDTDGQGLDSRPDAGSVLAAIVAVLLIALASLFSALRRERRRLG